MVRILLADNHDAIRDGIRRVLAEDTRIRVIDEACNFSEAIAKAHQISPDVLILDLHMPLGPGLSISDLRAQLNSCGARLLGMSFANDDDARSLATSMGAAELLDKMQLGKELIPSIMRVASANNRFSPALSVKPSDRSVA